MPMLRADDTPRPGPFSIWMRRSAMAPTMLREPSVEASSTTRTSSSKASCGKADAIAPVNCAPFRTGMTTLVDWRGEVMHDHRRSMNSAKAAGIAAGFCPVSTKKSGARPAAATNLLAMRSGCVSKTDELSECRYCVKSPCRTECRQNGSLPAHQKNSRHRSAADLVKCQPPAQSKFVTKLALRIRYRGRFVDELREGRGHISPQSRRAI